jgi:Na+/melibiose symporter-like transporter
MVKLAGAIQYLIVAVTLVVCGLYSITSEVGKIETSIASNEISKEAGTAIIEGLLSQASTGQMLGLSAAMTLVPVLLFIVEYFIIKKKYIITEEFYDQMISEIAMRKEDNNA